MLDYLVAAERDEEPRGLGDCSSDHTGIDDKARPRPVALQARPDTGNYGAIPIILGTEQVLQSRLFRTDDEVVIPRKEDDQDQRQWL